MKPLTFDQALTNAQIWVGQDDIYAVGESLDDEGNKIIMVFSQNAEASNEKIPNLFHGHKVVFHQSDEVVPQDIDQEE